MEDPQVASKALVDHALGRFSTDNLSCMVVRFNSQALKIAKDGSNIGVEGDHNTGKGRPSEADSLVTHANQGQDNSSNPGANSFANMPDVKEEDESTEIESDAPEVNYEATKLAVKMEPS